MAISRRRLLTSSLALSGAALVPITFATTRASDGFVEIRAQQVEWPLYEKDGGVSQLWSYDAQLPGPEIRAIQRERVRVRLINELPEPTTIHWHGIRIENRYDGVSGLTQEPVQPGESFEYDFVVPDAGTYWYHAHHKSWNQVVRGLYGPLIIDEPQLLFDREHDLTLMLDDWRLDEDGVLDAESLGSLHDWSHAGRLGNWLTVNGSSLPSFKLRKGEAYRLRLINASNARILEIDPNAFGARILAFDGQAVPEAFSLPYAPLLLAPAQRVDLLLMAKDNFAIEEISGREGFAFVEFEIEPGKNQSVPITLPANRLAEPELTNARTVTLEMTGGAMGRIDEIRYRGELLSGDRFRETGQVWAFNGHANLTETPFEQFKLGETIILETINNTAFPHAMHIHGHHFRILDRSGSDVDEGMPWRDTFVIGPDQTTKIAFVADNPGKWLLHCHMLEHAAAGMNNWFEVVA